LTCGILKKIVLESPPNTSKILAIRIAVHRLRNTGLMAARLKNTGLMTSRLKNTDPKNILFGKLILQLHIYSTSTPKHLLFLFSAYVPGSIKFMLQPFTFRTKTFPLSFFYPEAFSLHPPLFTPFSTIKSTSLQCL
jgi:hypothetical protein